MSVDCVPARAFASAQLDRHWKKVTKLGKHLNELDEREWHRLRKRIKSLRYTADFFAGMFGPEAARRTVRRLGALQDSFGALNDLVTAERLVMELSRGRPEIEEAGRAVIAVHRQLAEAVAEEAGRQWRKFARIEPFWRGT